MKDQARQGIAAAALVVIAAVAHQHINGVQCFTLSQSRHYPRGHQRISPNTRPHALYYRIDGDNQTDHETTSSKSENMIIEIQNQNATRDDIEENESQSNIIWGKKPGYAESGTLGDIMSGASQDDNSLDDTRTVDRIRTNVGEDDREVMNSKLKEGTEDNKSTQSGLVTSIGGTLTSQFGQKVPNLSPLDRIALTANGNLQRIFSSFYDAPVHVHVNHCVKRASGFPVEGSEKDLENAVWDRVVHLAVFDQNFCKATSVITVHSQSCAALVESGQLGIGQLFRFLDKLPTFTIVDAGRCENGGLWRRYKLECEELTCEILEELVPNAWQLQSDEMD